MLQALGTIGSVASGLGSLASGLGLGGKGSNWKGMRSGYEMQREYSNYAAQDALTNEKRRLRHLQKDIGLHPLSVVGTGNSYSAPSVSVGGSSDNGVNFAEMGQGVDRAVNAGRSAVQRKLDELALEKAQLSNDYLRTQIAGSQKALLANNSGAVPPVLPVSPRGSSQSAGNASGAVGDILKNWRSQQVGIADGIAPRHKYMIGTDGNKTRVLNTDVVGDNEILMAWDALISTMPDEMMNLLKRSYKNVRTRKYPNPLKMLGIHPSQRK